MCLRVKDIPKDFKPFTADKDIHVFKVLSRHNVCPKRLIQKYVYYTPFREMAIHFNFWGKCIMEADMNGRYTTIPCYKKTSNEHGIRYIPMRKTTPISWKNGELKYDIEETITDNCSLEIEDGIHAYTSFGNAAIGLALFDWPGMENPRDTLHKAVIPKGAHYFIGENGNIVSDKMIIYKKQLKK